MSSCTGAKHAKARGLRTCSTRSGNGASAADEVVDKVATTEGRDIKLEHGSNNKMNP